MPSKQPNVLVTGVGGRSVGHQVLHALNLLKDKYRIVCCDADSFAFGLYQGAARYIVPFAQAPNYLASILEIVRQQKIDILLPGTEAEIAVLAQEREALAAVGCHLVASSPETIALCNDKAVLYEWLAANNIGVPASCRVDGWKELVASVGFPIVAKPAKGSGGSRQVEILCTEPEVEEYIQRFSGDRAHIVFQEYVGDANSEYTVGVIVDRDGVAVESIALRRHLVGLSLGQTRTFDGRVYALSTGYSQGYIVSAPDIQRFCEGLAEKLGIMGPANIQLRTHGGVIKVFEVHPRFSGTTSIRADAGVNEPDLVIRNQLFGEKIGRQNYRTNVAAIRAFQNILVPMDDVAGVPKPAPGVR